MDDPFKQLSWNFDELNRSIRNLCRSREGTEALIHLERARMAALDSVLDAASPPLESRLDRSIIATDRAFHAMDLRQKQLLEKIEALEKKDAQRESEMARQEREKLVE